MSVSPDRSVQSQSWFSGSGIVIMICNLLIQDEREILAVIQIGIWLILSKSVKCSLIKVLLRT